MEITLFQKREKQFAPIAASRPQESDWDDAAPGMLARHVQQLLSQLHLDASDNECPECASRLDLPSRNVTDLSALALAGYTDTADYDHVGSGIYELF